MSQEHCIFVNVSYCFNKEKKPEGSFRYVKETGEAGEKHNFESMQYKGNDVCWGFLNLALQRVAMMAEENSAE